MVWLGASRGITGISGYVGRGLRVVAGRGLRVVVGRGLRVIGWRWHSVVGVLVMSGLREYGVNPLF